MEFGKFLTFQVEQRLLCRNSARSRAASIAQRVLLQRRVYNFRNDRTQTLQRIEERGQLTAGRWK